MPAGPPPMIGTIGASDSVDCGISRLWLRAAPGFARVGQTGTLVSRFRSSHHCAAASFANFGIEGHQQLIDLVWLWFRSPHFGLAEKMMRTSEPPHWGH